MSPLILLNFSIGDDTLENFLYLYFIRSVLFLKVIIIRHTIKFSKRICPVTILIIIWLWLVIWCRPSSRTALDMRLNHCQRNERVDVLSLLLFIHGCCDKQQQGYSETLLFGNKLLSGINYNRAGDPDPITR